MGEIRVLFCCMGNICRSPMAAGLFKSLVHQAGMGECFVIDSAGTHADFPDAPADPRAQRIMAERGIDLGAHRARRVTGPDFERFDLILVMDGHNYDTLRFVCPKPHAGKIGRLLDYAPELGRLDIPDPFHSDEPAFLRALELIESGTRGLWDHLRKSIDLS